MGLRVVVVGIPGVGKSTVVDKAVAQIDGASVLVFGTAMYDEAKRLGWVKNRDEMRKLRVERQRKLQKIAATKIAKSRGRAVFVDTHLFIRTPEGFWPGLPFDVVRALRPTHLVLVEAGAREILSRRSADKTRYRDEVSGEQVEGELALARSFLTAASLVSGAPMAFVQNQEGKAEEAAQQVVQMLQVASR